MEIEISLRRSLDLSQNSDMSRIEFRKLSLGLEVNVGSECQDNYLEVKVKTPFVNLKPQRRADNKLDVERVPLTVAESPPKASTHKQKRDGALGVLLTEQETSVVQEHHFQLSTPLPLDDRKVLRTSPIIHFGSKNFRKNIGVKPPKAQRPPKIKVPLRPDLPPPIVNESEGTLDSDYEGSLEMVKPTKFTINNTPDSITSRRQSDESMSVR